MKRFLTSLAISLAVAVCGFGAAVPAVASAISPAQQACQAVANNKGCNDNSGGPSVRSLVHLVVTILSWIVGIAAVIMLIVGGLRYVTSSGDSNTASEARGTIIYALVGLAVVAMAQFIVQFIVNRVTH